MIQKPPLLENPPKEKIVEVQPMYYWNTNYAHISIKKCQGCIRVVGTYKRGKWIPICAAGWDPQVEWNRKKCKFAIFSNNPPPESN